MVGSDILAPPRMVEKTVLRKNPISLTVQVSLFLALAAIIPLIITIASSLWISRPELISQEANAMSLNAHSQMQLIDAYLLERLHDVETISRLPFIHKYVGGDGNSQQAALDELSSGDQRDSSYDSWSLFSADNTLLSWYPTRPIAHGKYFILPANSASIQQSHQASISDVFDDTDLNAASIDLYAPIVTPGAQVIGTLRATLRLDYIYNIIDGQADSKGSYGMLLDQNGVRIGYTNSDPSNITQPAPLFKAVAPLSSQTRQRIADENLYGNAKKPVSALEDASLAQIQSGAHAASTFEITPTEQQQSFEAARETSTIVSWSYVVFSPLSAITTIADQQLLYISIIAALVLILAALAGIGVGRRITQPILKSVTSLLHSSQLLKKLASGEAVTATEQQWMIDASQEGMKSVQYYTQAASIATKQLREHSEELLQNASELHMLPKIRQQLEQIVSISKYVEHAVRHQEKSNKSLATAIRVTTQVTDQLASGATSAEQASAQLEQVVEQLRQIVGR